MELRRDGTVSDSLSSARFAHNEYEAQPWLEMYLTPATLYALKLSFQQSPSFQGAVSTAFRKNMIERNITKSAFVLATVGLSMSIFSVRKMLTSKHRGRL
ncbi:hypothetical protein ANTQUA_LOCUS4508 [Anthophora quadrimaculata]